MKKGIKILSLIGILAFGLFMMNSCKKKDAVPQTLDAETQSASTDNSQAEKTFSDAFDITNDATKMAPGCNKTAQATTIISGCTSVTLDPGTDSLPNHFPKSVTVTFGNGSMTDSCLGKDGRYRKGKIHLKIENCVFSKAGSKITVTLDNYYVDNYKVEGSKTITNSGVNLTDANGTYNQYDINVSGGKITAWNGAFLTWQSTRTIKTYLGVFGIINYALITGNASGLNVHGVPYAVTITSPLKVAVGCMWIESGSFDLTSNNNKVSVDFGTGACDRLANVTYNGKVYTIEMR